jgi:hypothetical protein
MGAAARGRVRLDAVSVTACGALSRADTSDQPTCTCVRAVRDEEAAGSNPATPTRENRLGHHLSRAFVTVSQSLPNIEVGLGAGLVVRLGAGLVVRLGAGLVVRTRAR